MLARFVIILGLCVLWTELLFIYYQPFYIHLGVSAATLGIVFAVLSVCSAIGSYAMRALPNKINAHGINSVTLLAAVVTGLLHWLSLPAVLWAPVVLGVASGLTYPNLRLYVNQHANNKTRAATTVITIGSLAGTGRHRLCWA